MNYYEELGVDRSASILEIQQAYRALVRILHPDQQQDEKLRKLSELQLIRLNQLAGVLTDPEKRREYDRSLNALLPGPYAAAVPQKVAIKDLRGVRIRLRLPRPGALIWGLLALIAAATIFFALQEPREVPVARAADAVRTVAAEPKAPSPKPANAATEPVRPQRDVKMPARNVVIASN